MICYSMVLLATMEQVQRFEVVSPDCSSVRWSANETQPFIHCCYGNLYRSRWELLLFKEVLFAYMLVARGVWRWLPLRRYSAQGPAHVTYRQVHQWRIDIATWITNILVLTDLSMRSQTSIFPFLLVIKNTPTVSNKNTSNITLKFFTPPSSYLVWLGTTPLQSEVLRSCMTSSKHHSG